MKLITKRLTIRNMKIDDVDDLFSVYSDNKTMKYIEPIFSLEQTQKFIEKYGLITDPLVYSIEINDTSKVIGHLIYHTFENDQTYEVGIILQNQHWNKGYASEILKEIIDIAKEKKIDLVIECDKNNSTMIHLAEKFNFHLFESKSILLLYKLPY